MRIAGLILGTALGLAAAASATAAPVITPVPPMPEASNLVRIAGGCGWGFHRTYRGYCVRNHPYRPYAYTHRYGYGPSPSDHVANQLNEQELRRGY